MSSPGIFLSTIRVSFGSGDNSGSSTIACLMLRPASVSIFAEFARIPGVFASSGVISRTPKSNCLAISLSECPAGRISSKICRSSRFSLIIIRVWFTVLLSTPAALAIRIGGISIWLSCIFPFLMLRPFSTRIRATFSRSGYSSRFFLIEFHIKLCNVQLCTVRYKYVPCISGSHQITCT